ncbi:uncharacterized protein METZ01_LOCUS214594, partial [marine metagenome]
VSTSYGRLLHGWPEVHCEAHWSYLAGDLLPGTSNTAFLNGVPKPRDRSDENKTPLCKLAEATLVFSNIRIKHLLALKK